MERVLNIFNIVLEVLLENRTVFFITKKDEEKKNLFKKISEKNTLYFFLDKNGTLQKEGQTKNIFDLLDLAITEEGFLLVINSDIKTNFCLEKRQEDWFYNIVEKTEEKTKTALLIKL